MMAVACVNHFNIKNDIAPILQFLSKKINYVQILTWLSFHCLLA